VKIEKEIIAQLEMIYRIMIQKSFSIEQNHHAVKNGLINWTNCRNISFALRNQPYEEIYEECVKEKAYNFMLIDGALIQMMYNVENNELIKHRLAYYPKPNSERFIDSPDDFEEIHFGTDMFTDIDEKRAVVFPIRIDFDLDKSKFVNCEHSFVHLTLGNHNECRIPVSKPISPNKFISFILMSFYLSKFKEEKLTLKDFECLIPFQYLITKEEATMVHINH
jgi:hypothetical protein